MSDVGTEAGDPAERLIALAELVRYHNRRYHELDDPEISDADFDARTSSRRVSRTSIPAERRCCSTRSAMSRLDSFSVTP